MTRGAKAYQTLLIWPYAVAPAIAAVLWSFLFNPSIGLVTYALAKYGIVWNHALNPGQAMFLVVLASVWQQVSYNFLFFYAGLQAIPEVLYEAARMDGASRWRLLRSITLPMLAPILLIVSILTIAGYFQLFAEPYVMTQGGPLQSTVSVLYFMYEQGFKWWNLGFASSVAFVLFALIFAVTALQRRQAREVAAR